MAIGKVKWFNDSKGFGMIERSEGDEVFVHYSSITQEGHKTLNQGQEVEFDLYVSPKGPQAKNVMRRD